MRSAHPFPHRCLLTALFPEKSSFHHRVRPLILKVFLGGRGGGGYVVTLLLPQETKGTIILSLCLSLPVSLRQPTTTADNQPTTDDRQHHQYPWVNRRPVHDYPPALSLCIIRRLILRFNQKQPHMMCLAGAVAQHLLIEPKN